jgi:DNA-binding CsgD family transcriptional regulator
MLGMYAMFSVYNLFACEAQVIGVPLMRVYVCLCAGGAAGAGVFALLHMSFGTRPRLMRLLLGVFYVLSPVLTALSVLCAQSRAHPAFFWIAVAGVFALIGFNLSMSASLINLMMREMRFFGVRLGLSLAAGIAAAALPAHIFSPSDMDSPQAYEGFFVASAASYAAAVAVMALLAFVWAEVPERLRLAEEEYGSRGLTAGIPGRQYFGGGVPIRRILVGNAATILIFSLWIGANDIYAAHTQQALPDAFSLPLILFIAPGLAIGGVLADIGRGTLLSLAAVGFTLLLSPLSASLGAPENHFEVFWVSGIVHGFFLFHITFVLPSVISFGKHSPAVFSLIGVLYFIGAGAGALFSDDFVAMGDLLHRLFLAAAVFGVLLAFLLFSGIQPFAVRGRGTAGARGPASVIPAPEPESTRGSGDIADALRDGIASSPAAPRNDTDGATSRNVIPAPEPESTRDTGGAPDSIALAEFAAAHGLSERETDVLECLLRGCSTEEMTRQLYVTENTIRYHIKALNRKTGARSRIEVVAMCTARTAPH